MAQDGSDALWAISNQANALLLSAIKRTTIGTAKPLLLPLVPCLCNIGATLGLTKQQCVDVLGVGPGYSMQGVELSQQDIQGLVQQLVQGLVQSAKERLPKIYNGSASLNSALQDAFISYCKMSLGQSRASYDHENPRMNEAQLTRLCQDAGFLEPAGALSTTSLAVMVASNRTTSSNITRLTYPQFLKVIGSIASDLRGDVFITVAGLGLQTKPLPALGNNLKMPPTQTPRNWALPNDNDPAVLLAAAERKIAVSEGVKKVASLPHIGSDQPAAPQPPLQALPNLLEPERPPSALGSRPSPGGGAGRGLGGRRLSNSSDGSFASAPPARASLPGHVTGFSSELLGYSPVDLEREALALLDPARPFTPSALDGSALSPLRLRSSSQKLLGPSSLSLDQASRLEVVPALEARLAEMEGRENLMRQIMLDMSRKVGVPLTFPPPTPGPDPSSQEWVHAEPPPSPCLPRPGSAGRGGKPSPLSVMGADGSASILGVSNVSPKALQQGGGGSGLGCTAEPSLADQIGELGARLAGLAHSVDSLKQANATKPPESPLLSGLDQLGPLLPFLRQLDSRLAQAEASLKAQAEQVKWQAEQTNRELELLKSEQQQLAAQVAAGKLQVEQEMARQAEAIQAAGQRRRGRSQRKALFEGGASATSSPGAQQATRDGSRQLAVAVPGGEDNDEDDELEARLDRLEATLSTLAPRHEVESRRLSRAQEPGSPAGPNLGWIAELEGRVGQVEALGDMVLQSLERLEPHVAQVKELDGRVALVAQQLGQQASELSSQAQALQGEVAPQLAALGQRLAGVEEGVREAGSKAEAAAAAAAAAPAPSKSQGTNTNTSSEPDPTLSLLRLLAESLSSQEVAAERRLTTALRPTAEWAQQEGQGGSALASQVGSVGSSRRGSELVAGPDGKALEDTIKGILAASPRAAAGADAVPPLLAAGPGLDEDGGGGRTPLLLVAADVGSLAGGTPAQAGGAAGGAGKADLVQVLVSTLLRVVDKAGRAAAAREVPRLFLRDFKAAVALMDSRLGGHEVAIIRVAKHVDTLQARISQVQQGAADSAGDAQRVVTHVYQMGGGSSKPREPIPLIVGNTQGMRPDQYAALAQSRMMGASAPQHAPPSASGLGPPSHPSSTTLSPSAPMAPAPPNRATSIGAGYSQGAAQLQGPSSSGSGSGSAPSSAPNTSSHMDGGPMPTPPPVSQRDSPGPGPAPRSLAAVQASLGMNQPSLLLTESSRSSLASSIDRHSSLSDTSPTAAVSGNNWSPSVARGSPRAAAAREREASGSFRRDSGDGGHERGSGGSGPGPTRLARGTS